MNKEGDDECKGALECQKSDNNTTNKIAVVTKVAISVVVDVVDDDDDDGRFQCQERDAVEFWRVVEERKGSVNGPSCNGWPGGVN